MIKSGRGTASRFELFDLSSDPQQTRNIADQFPGVAERLKQTVMSINASVLKDAPSWSTSSDTSSKTQTSTTQTSTTQTSTTQTSTTQTSTTQPSTTQPTPGKASKQVHRLQSTQLQSPFDAFAYVNRIPTQPEPDETQEDLCGRILGRLANQEGRILIKLPPQMNRSAYEGFKVALETDLDQHSGRCFTCHHFPNLGQPNSQPPVASLRNQTLSREQLLQLLRNETHRDIEIDNDDATRLHHFLKTLADIPKPNSQQAFRNLILQSKVLNTLGEAE